MNEVYKKPGKDLIFISVILRDGSGTIPVDQAKNMSHLDNVVFNITCLSVTKQTYIASEFNSYVVKLK